MNSKILCKFDRFGDAELRLTMQEYKGRPNLSLREWTKSDDGDYLPTKKGITIREDEIDLVQGALEAAKGFFASFSNGGGFSSGAESVSGEGPDGPESGNTMPF